VTLGPAVLLLNRNYLGAVPVFVIVPMAVGASRTNDPMTVLPSTAYKGTVRAPADVCLARALAGVVGADGLTSVART